MQTNANARRGEEMKHKCDNWLDNRGFCEKCGKPEWANYFKNPFKIGDKVRIPKHYTFGGQILKIAKQLKDGRYQLKESDGNVIESYEWWELRPFNK